MRVSRHSANHPLSTPPQRLSGARVAAVFGSTSGWPSASSNFTSSSHSAAAVPEAHQHAIAQSPPSGPRLSIQFVIPFLTSLSASILFCSFFLSSPACLVLLPLWPLSLDQAFGNRSAILCLFLVFSCLFRSSRPQNLRVEPLLFSSFGISSFCYPCPFFFLFLSFLNLFLSTCPILGQNVLSNRLFAAIQ